jgi:hypothetical protein
VRTGTIVRASRRQIGVAIVWDGDAHASAHRHNDCVNPVDDAIDMLDGRGVRVGMRVESVPEGRFRLTGESFAADQEPESGIARGLDTPKKFLAHAKSRKSPAERADLWLLANGFESQGGPKVSLDLDDEEGLIR